MHHKRRPFPFRWILPLTELVLCAFLLGPYWLALRFVAEKSTPTFAIAIENEDFHPERHLPSTPEQHQALNLLEFRVNLAAGLNMPAGFVQLPYVILNPEKTEWLPTKITWMPPLLLNLWIWRAFTWPFIAIVFWWMAGRGCEALAATRAKIATPRIRLIEVLFALVFVVLAGGICIMYISEGAYDPISTAMGVGGAVWAILGAITVTAYVLQWRLRRQAKIAITAESPA